MLQLQHFKIGGFFLLFSSSTFIYLFLPIALFFYYILFRKNRKFQNIFLFLSSLFFYAWGEPKFVLVMFTSIVINWFWGLLVSSKRNNKTLCKIIVTISVFFNLSLLFIFKYLSFSCTLINNVFETNIPIRNITLPIGISFFTFQAMSYVIDVYRQRAQVQKKLLYVGLYISFFPQLIAGPIVRYETVADEILNRKETLDDFVSGFTRFIIGLGKKLLLSNSLAFLADTAFNPASYNNLSIAFAWLGAIAYTLQIFFDFCGYSDMAIGLGKMFGFHFLENFNYPYISTSITEFWRRWHISLGTWFKDYLYFPLGGSRVKTPRLIFNLFVVWFATGLWHGADYTFILWGLLYFVLIVFEKLTGFSKKSGRVINCFKLFYTMFFVIMGWVLFRASSLPNAINYYKSLFGLAHNALFDNNFIIYFKQYYIFIIIAIVLSTPIFRIIKAKFESNKIYNIISGIGLIILFIISLSNLISDAYNPFIYFNF